MINFDLHFSLRDKAALAQLPGLETMLLKTVSLLNLWHGPMKTGHATPRVAHIVRLENLLAELTVATNEVLQRFNKHFGRVSYNGIDAGNRWRDNGDEAE